MPFNGVNGQRILLAINGIVFDVSRGRNFYGPGIRSPLPAERPSLRQFKRECTPTFLAEMLRAGWPNSRLMKVRLGLQGRFHADGWRSEMLTDIDQPLDKLEDLTPSEM